jgi:ATP-dependent RNA helicase SUPV3L1/SUV3
MCPYDCEYYARLATRRMCTAWKILHRTFKAFKPPVKRSVVRKEGVYGVAGFHGTKLLGEDIVQNPCVSYKNMAHEVKSELRKVRLQWLNSSSHHLSRGQFNALFHRFCKSVVKCSGGDDLKDDVMLVASQKSDVEILRPHFLRLVAQYYPEVTHLERLREISDLSSPAQWFPAARKLNRRFIYHSGPTNSGKTHEALQKFSEASSGIYCAPLRMLAAEIYLRCNEENVPCDLLTGEERVLVGEFEAPHLSCTVEMASTSGTRIYDVGIIDEIQMLADEERGSAWTRVILGLNAREIHLCGNSSAVSIVERMLSTTGESLEVRQYDRLSPLIPSRRTLNHDYKKVKEGDCVVAFSRMKIFNIKKKIEALTGLQCAVIYGGLPPVTRVEQAKLFNDPDSKYKVLVASDAIGMGLNL